ncbi:YqaE/Pmp3 family membrane protein [Roseiconus lacunae]|uniref:YqaE/Pmp3 family membrane protein n=1 Tax=Roseiconus lacunae TaxID=2605694 RepID=A0ABT7PM38_9BACT|nr:YqaE/Pmp3 family membrane protein [Roseiconus lacunae]MCD0462692.1 YqaE/Pmp3 family membrane protein [Roseiconus lacunae]MDM4017221.1 YqaE/Pmp3 family membrane protein [Roseiconus lacunae]WRQ51201.1 YqaE/Pmp3 family membrane protein [Stieleria sp. HD01]
MSTTTTHSTNTLLMVILAVLLPPLAVFMDRGLGTQFVLNIVLTLVGFWIIGIIHALAVVL